MTYRFHKDFLGQIMAHISAYNFVVSSLSIANDYYTANLSDTISEDEFTHLQENYGLEIV